MVKSAQKLPNYWSAPSAEPSPYAEEQFTRSKSCAYHLLLGLFLGGQVLVRVVQGRVNRRHVMDYMVAAGPQSLPPVLMTNLFAGMIFTIQTARELIRYGAAHALGGAFALAFCRELAPILTAAILAGQVGSAFAAEIGCMKVTEQIDALKMLRTDPVDYLVVPRVLACCVMLPILTILSLVVGIGGGIFVAHQFYDIAPVVFLESVRSLLELQDLVMVLVKSTIFGAMIALFACSWGLTTTTSKSVGESATAAVVTTWVSLFVVDFFLSLTLFSGVQIH
ncbi:MAG: MlaE family lipid ABC transporter permease subunit [Leptolyngbyaceae cyanobacterium SM1_1_3]|nr:MlaE family lipid ABC transporter permease subunit [Leptolyngbyaceae cyanobacterium SM1_1_3]NJN01087.1 MlaE family lipid ABC transporter permease subunit [Leptolyngbyaceae cyanobacterium RM1_1_2]NJO11553.1 MlaE family lipid ABC transporter permease subunit [Leptolyngbyaceae cyanobacterium SL_1_1]